MRKIDIEAERKYENSKILSSEVRSKQNKFYWATDLSIREHREKTNQAILKLNGLEIGCSSGIAAVEYSKYCSKYTGIDIADEAIKKAKDKNIHNCEFICTDGHKLPFDDETFDFVIVNSLLHHLDLDLIFEEISRVLLPSGKIIFREPLGTNPIIQIYRFFTPSARTVDERPFTFADIKLMKSYFDLVDVRWFGFLNILAGFYKNHKLRIFLTNFDNFLSKSPLKYIFWQFAGTGIKKTKKISF